MRKMFLENIPIYRGNMSWKNSVGLIINFIYEDTEGFVEIIDYKYINKRGYLTIKYENSYHDILTEHFKNCNIGEIINKFKLYKFAIGDIIKDDNKNIEILEHKRIETKTETRKGYLYKCLNDGYIGEILENKLLRNQKTPCPICINKKINIKENISKEINNIATTHSHMVKYFVNIDDTYKYSYGMDNVVKLKCPDCGYEKEGIICNLFNQGFSCNECSDHVSFPEKFMANIFNCLNIKFKPQKKFSWSQNKRYDFYINNTKGENILVEVHGDQHYNNGFSTCNGRTLEEEQENDRVKELLAKENGIENYIIIDARLSDMEYIKNSILQSHLNNLFNLETVNWVDCATKALVSYVKIACDHWNTGVKNTKEISEIMNMNRTTITRYLTKGAELGMCNYNSREVLKESSSNNGKIGKKKVLCLNNGVIYNSMTEASLFSDVSISRISDCCNNKIKEAKGYKFEFYKVNEGDNI